MFKKIENSGEFYIDKKSLLTTDIRWPFMAISHSSTLMTVLRPALKATKSRRWGLLNGSPRHFATRVDRGENSFVHASANQCIIF
jgi:hypothetical protein